MSTDFEAYDCRNGGATEARGSLADEFLTFSLVNRKIRGKQFGPLQPDLPSVYRLYRFCLNIVEQKRTKHRREPKIQSLIFGSVPRGKP